MWRRNAARRFLQGGSSLDGFRGFLSRVVGRPVLDRTGLQGKWDFLLTYTNQDLLRPGELPPADSPDLFTAIREQLGLKLESTTGPVEMFVVDRIEPPSENRSRHRRLAGLALKRRNLVIVFSEGHDTSSFLTPGRGP